MNRYILAFCFKFLILFLIYALFQIVFARFGADKQRSVRQRAIFGIVLCYAAALLWQLLIPKLGWLQFRTGTVNWVPSKTIVQFLSGDIPVNPSDITNACMQNLLFNIASFVPFGFVPLLAKKANSLFAVVSCCILTNIPIEAFQYFTGKSADIDDIFLRLIGAAIGFAALKLIKLQKARHASHLVPHE